MDIQSDIVQVMSTLGFDPGDLRREARIKEDLGIDSTEMTEVVVALENYFSLKIDTSAIDGFVTFGDVVGHLTEHLVANRAEKD
ncbi:acyl carrier protein [Streptomyces collinus]|uniref:acyl carrier protein n=1 Tax=Streptomyces collinus TaxID=42684 RepID=UPI0038142BA5